MANSSDGLTPERFKQLLKRAKSKSVLENYSVTDTGKTVTPDQNLKTAINTIEKDPVVRGAVKWKTDRVLESGWRVIHTEDNKPDKNFEDKLNKEFNFESDYLVPVVHSLCWVQNAFGEIVRGEGTGQVVGLNGLDATTINPQTKPNGDPVEYESQVENPKTGERPTWDPDKITWFKLDERKRGYAPVEVKTVHETVMTKNYARQFIAWLFDTGQYRNIHNLKDTSEDALENFLSMENKTRDLTQPLVVAGDYEQDTMRDMEELGGFSELFDMLNQELSVALRVPPTALGIPEGSGRSTADTMSDVGLTNVRNIKRTIQTGINNDMFPKINKGNNKFIWKPTDLHEERRILERLNVLNNLGITDEAKEEYLRDHGMVFDTDTVFAEEESSGTKDIDNMPSRFNPDDAPQDDIGTGDESSTREEQLDDRENPSDTQ